MDASALDIAISTLEKSVSRLELSIDNLEVWLWVSSAAVAIGVTLELYFLIHEYLSDREAWLKGFISSPSKPGLKLLLFEIASVLLVVAGIVGELGVGVIAASKNSELRSVNNRLVGLIREKVGLADKDAGDAKERAGKLEKEAARLNKLAQDEALKVVGLQKQLAPRTLNDADRIAIGQQLHQFAPRFTGRKVKISSYSADAEGIVFSLEILDILTQAGIDTDPIIGRTIPVGLVNLGVNVTGPSADEMFIRSLMTGIRAKVDTTLHGEWGPKYSNVSVEVGVKPVAGLPAVTPASPK